MRCLLSVTGLMLVLMLCCVGPAEAKGGRGRRHSGGGQCGPNGCGPKHTHAAPAKKTEKVQLADSRQKPAKEVMEKVKHTSKNKASGDSAGDLTETANKKEKQLELFQKQRDKKIAQAEHLRLNAEKNGNANLAANADRMEAQAHSQYAKKVEHLEKFGVTDPTLDPDGGITDPPLPPTDPLIDPINDPVGALEGLLPFGL